MRRPRGFWKQGEPWVWASGSALALVLVVTLTALYVVFAHGLAVFWPSPIDEITLADGSQLLGQRLEEERDPLSGRRRIKFYCANMEDMPPFRWIYADQIVQQRRPPEVFKLDRAANLHYIGYLKEIRLPSQAVAQADGAGQPASVVLEPRPQASPAAPSRPRGLEVSPVCPGSKAEQLAQAIRWAKQWEAAEVAPWRLQENRLAQQLNDQVKYALIEARYALQQLLRAGRSETEPTCRALAERIAQLTEEENRLKAQAHQLSARRAEQETKLRQNVALFVDVQGREKQIPLVDIVRFSTPNSMSLWAKCRFYLAKWWELLTDQPREANQDGGIFPAILGTVLLVFLMAIVAFPLGVLAGVYLGEYARDNLLVRWVRVAVNNLAGIPSIVYGIFGLGFFIYLCGGTLDAWFYPDRVEAGEPVFGQPCILWAALTLGLLTLPVVIVSTEEALRQIPREIREGSYALGATKLQTLLRVLLPMASPGVMTGFILAMARAVGEVAPLMITGAVKSAPPPIAAQFPFLRLDRQFMHLGYHILDISCKSPNVEATKGLVYATTLLLLAIVLALTSTAIWLRNRMRKRYYVRAI